MPSFFDTAIWRTPLTGLNTSGLVYYQWLLGTVSLTVAGWTITSSGDGLAVYSAVGNVITSGAAGANGLGNARAWIRIEDPIGGSEFIIQVIGATTSRVKYSPAAGFTGGAPDFQTVPSATDEVVLKGGGTDAAPTGEGDFNTADVADPLIGGIETVWPFRFWMGMIDVGAATRAPYFAFYRDYLWPGWSNINILDTDPTAVAICRAAGANNNFLIANYAPGSGNGRVVGQLSGQMQELRTYFWGGAGVTMFPDAMVANSWDSELEICPFFYERQTGIPAPRGTKGWARERFLWGPDIGTAAGNADCRFLNVDGGTRNYMQMGNQCFPWNGSMFAEGGLGTTDVTVRTPEFIEQPIVYRMRALNGSGNYVYWNADVPDQNLAVAQLNPASVGVFTDVVVDRVLRGR